MSQNFATLKPAISIKALQTGQLNMQQLPYHSPHAKKGLHTVLPGMLGGMMSHRNNAMASRASGEDLLNMEKQ